MRKRWHDKRNEKERERGAQEMKKDFRVVLPYLRLVAVFSMVIQSYAMDEGLS